MPAAALHPTTAARLFVLSVDLPGQGSIPAGVILHDTAANGLHVRLRRDWEVIADEEDTEVLAELADDLENKAAEFGAAKFLRTLEDSLSNTVRISEPRDVLVEDFPRALERHYRQTVSPHELPFVTHLPRYSVAVAAGKFLENAEVEADGWEEAPPGLRLTPEMFVARIEGRSMEPRIPDGSLCVFKGGVTGSRQGRLVLVELQGGGTNDRYTVKRYSSVKTQRPDGTWEHERIRLEPLNPEFDAWDLDPAEEGFHILAEFVQVLD